MKAEIHPKYYEAKVTCASCGAAWTSGSTRKEIRVEICSNCHPFYTGEQSRIIDMEGQVDRFYRKLQARHEYVETQKAKESEKVSPKRPVAELELGTRPTKSLAEAGITEVGQLLAKLAEGEAAALAIDGFGRKSLIDAKKKLRALGYEVPESTTEAA
jgi:large subunit ribosomal protein L31